jgi:hypothetical protein
MNGKSFHGLEEYKKMPMQEWMACAQIHAQAVKREQDAWK